MDEVIIEWRKGELLVKVLHGISSASLGVKSVPE